MLHDFDSDVLSNLQSSTSFTLRITKKRSEIGYRRLIEEIHTALVMIKLRTGIAPFPVPSGPDPPFFANLMMTPVAPYVRTSNPLVNGS